VNVLRTRCERAANVPQSQGLYLDWETPWHQMLVAGQWADDDGAGEAAAAAGGGRPDFKAGGGGGGGGRGETLGGEVCVWAERIDATNLQCRTWPRAAAAAARMWMGRARVAALVRPTAAQAAAEAGARAEQGAGAEAEQGSCGGGVAEGTEVTLGVESSAGGSCAAADPGPKAAAAAATAAAAAAVEAEHEAQLLQEWRRPLRCLGRVARRLRSRGVDSALPTDGEDGAGLCERLPKERDTHLTPFDAAEFAPP
jgi:hypothetical protein